MWCSAADAYLKLLDSAVCGASFLTGGVFECGIAHRRFVAVLCMFNKIRCNPTHPLNGALLGRYMYQYGLQTLLWSHIGILMRSLAAEPHSISRLLFPSQWPSSWNNLAVSVFDGVGGFQEQSQCFFIGLSCSNPTIVFYYFSLSLFSVYRLVLWG